MQNMTNNMMALCFSRTENAYVLFAQECWFEVIAMTNEGVVPMFIENFKT